ncbi:hypothetical protein B0J11DRAFT_540024 [Dendryphion nanum]|uniref:Mtf2-like C-terminal domain-containing protein n=1 Tax=Dendryphion nanum TaxID=256645 RepID=A0A9P9IBC8_9PLEO|nr:hypothetical protein B0J11DRAFT_540024 [Dendryphion nanum]
MGLRQFAHRAPDSLTFLLSALCWWCSFLALARPTWWQLYCSRIFLFCCGSMPICRGTVGALSRSRATSTFSASKTLVPFLYQTATIQQRKPTVQPIAHRTLSSRSNREDDIPFETTEALPPTIESYFGSSRKTTITGSERAAFEKLYKNFSAEGSQAHEDLPFNHEIDQIADEWYEEDDDKEPGGSSLDAVFDAVLAGIPEGGPSKKPLDSGEDLHSLAQRIMRPDSEEMKKKASMKEVAAEVARIKGIRVTERNRVQLALKNSTTDRELWNVLEHEVFGMIKKLDLDGLRQQQAQQQAEGMIEDVPHSETTPKKKSPKNKSSLAVSSSKSNGSPASNRPIDPNSDPRILFPNFPTHLVYAARLYRIYFPASALPFSILPTLKSLGRSSYALGATSPLYNIIIRIAWTQLSSYDYIDQLLIDMENGGIEFDVKTLETLDWILVEDARAHRGTLGQSIANIWRMEQFEEGSEKIRRWRDVVAQRLGVWAADSVSSRIRTTHSGSQTRTRAAQGPGDYMTVDPAEARISRYAASDVVGPKVIQRPSRRPLSKTTMRTLRMEEKASETTTPELPGSDGGNGPRSG